MLFKLQLCIFRVSARGQKKKWSQCSARRFHHTFRMGGAWRVLEKKSAYAMATKSSAPLLYSSFMANSLGHTKSKFASGISVERYHIRQFTP